MSLPLFACHICRARLRKPIREADFFAQSPDHPKKTFGDLSYSGVVLLWRTIRDTRCCLSAQNCGICNGGR
jgi:hypothetical protein